MLLHTFEIFDKATTRCYMDLIWRLRTRPSFKHVADEELDEARLRLWDVARAAVEDRHHDR